MKMIFAALALATAPAAGSEPTLPPPPPLPPSSELAAEKTFAPENVRFEKGVLTVRAIGLTLPLGDGWTLRMPEGARATLDRGTARIQLSVADWPKGADRFELKTAVLAGMTHSGTIVSRSSNASYGGLSGTEGWGDSTPAHGSPRDTVRVHMVGLLGGDRAYFFAVKAPKADFDAAEDAFLAGLRTMTIQQPAKEKR